MSAPPNNVDARESELVRILQVATADGSGLEECSKAWEDILARWNQGETVDVVRALIQSQVNQHLFLSKLLCHIWNVYIGEGPKAMGNYIAESESLYLSVEGKDMDSSKSTVLELLVYCGCQHPSLDGPTKDMMTAGAWSHIHRAPRYDRWSDLLDMNYQTDGDQSQRVESIVHEAAETGADLDRVIALCLHVLPEGIVGCGESVESRAYLFCCISRAYDYRDDVLSFQSPSNPHKLLPILKTIQPQPHDYVSSLRRLRLLNVFLEQMCPILETFPGTKPSLAPAEQKHSTNDAAMSTSNDSSNMQRDRLPPFWLFAVDLSSAYVHQRDHWQAVWQLLQPLLSAACVHYEQFPTLSSPLGTSSIDPIPLINIVALIITGNCSKEYPQEHAEEETTTDDDGRPVEPVVARRAAQGDIAPIAHQTNQTGLHIPPAMEVAEHQTSFESQNAVLPGFGRRRLQQVLSTRIVDVHILLRASPDSFITKAWDVSLPALLKYLATHLTSATPTRYSGLAGSVACTVADLYRLDSDNILDYNQLCMFWLRLVAHCGEYAEGFKEAMTEHIDRKAAEKIFSGIFNLLDPFADEKKKEAIVPLQTTYADAVYLDNGDLPPHLIDYFINICIDLARKKTALAQALVDAGLVTLLTAIRDGVYEYPEAADLQPPNVRAIIRQQMCNDAFAVLAEQF